MRRKPSSSPLANNPIHRRLPQRFLCRGHGTLRPLSPFRLHPSPHKGRCGDSAQDCFRIYAEFKAILSSQSRHPMQPHSNTSGARGGPGGMHSLAFPPAAFRRFRRAKAALCSGFARRLPAIAVAVHAKAAAFPDSKQPPCLSQGGHFHAIISIEYTG